MTASFYCCDNAQLARGTKVVQIRLLKCESVLCTLLFYVKIDKD